MLVDKLLQLQTDARKRIELAENPEALEIVRIEVLGRKGSLAAISKEMGKLTPEERASVGKLLNATKQALESAFDSKKSGFENAALAKKLDAEWVDLTLPAPGTRRAACIRSRGSSARLKKSSPRWASPCWTVPRWRPNTTTSTR